MRDRAFYTLTCDHSFTHERRINERKKIKCEREERKPVLNGLNTDNRDMIFLQQKKRFCIQSFQLTCTAGYTARNIKVLE